MKLAVTVNQPQSGIHFKPMEEVHGRVELRACEKQKMPVCISIFFKGDDTPSFSVRRKTESRPDMLRSDG